MNNSDKAFEEYRASIDHIGRRHGSIKCFMAGEAHGREAALARVREVLKTSHYHSDPVYDPAKVIEDIAKALNINLDD